MRTVSVSNWLSMTDTYPSGVATSPESSIARGSSTVHTTSPGTGLGVGAGAGAGADTGAASRERSAAASRIGTG
jgi:hypothetical protein